jgi:hypothetical protein
MGKTNFIPKKKDLKKCPTCHCQKTERTGRTASAEIGKWIIEKQSYEDEPTLVEYNCTACSEKFYLPLNT